MTMTEVTREELKRRIEVADRVLWETPVGRYVKDREWLECERARLVCELKAQGPAIAEKDDA
jgi:hypothetical protein